MKKMTKLMALLLAVVMVLALTACKKEADKTTEAPNATNVIPTGANANQGIEPEPTTPASEGNETDAPAPSADPAPVDGSIVGNWTCNIDLSEMLGKELGGSGMEEYFDFSNLMMPINATFNADGTYTLHMDGDAIKGRTKEIMLEGMTKLLTEQGMTVEDYEEKTGAKLEDSLDEMMGDGPETEDFNGNYKVEGDTLYLGDDSGSFDGASKCTIALGANELRVTEIDTSVNDDSIEMVQQMLPLVFTR